MRLTRLTLAALVAALLLAPLAHGADLGSDPFQNISPASQLGGDSLRERHPLSHYELDQNVDVSIGNLESIPALVAQTIAAAIWSVTKLLASGVIDLFTWAFSLDLLGGKDGALNPVADAIGSVYEDVLGQAWLVVAILAAGLWGIWKALVQRRYTETAGALALSVLCVVVALFFVHQPERTVGQVSKWTNDLSLAFLGAVNGAGPDAKREVADHLFRTLVYEPWAVLNFGGLEVCTDTGREVQDGYPMPVACEDETADTSRDVLAAAGAARAGYAERFLKHPPGSGPRKAEFEALRDGELPAEEGPGGDPLRDALIGGAGAALGPGGAAAANGVALAAGQADSGPEPGQFKGWSVDRSDSPAVDIQQAGGAFGRLALSALIFVANLGAVCLIGFLSLAVILSQVFALVLLAFAPVALVVAVYPGRGHAFFRSWLVRLFSALLVKAAYSLVLAIVLAIGAAVAAASGRLGFLFAYGLEATFFWGVFIYRRQIVDRLLGATLGSGGDEAQGGAARAGSSTRTVLAAATGGATWAVAGRLLGGGSKPTEGAPGSPSRRPVPHRSADPPGSDRGRHGNVPRGRGPNGEGGSPPPPAAGPPGGGNGAPPSEPFSARSAGPAQKATAGPSAPAASPVSSADHRASRSDADERRTLQAHGGARPAMVPAAGSASPQEASRHPREQSPAGQPPAPAAAAAKRAVAESPRARHERLLDQVEDRRTPSRPAERTIPAVTREKESG